MCEEFKSENPEIVNPGQSKTGFRFPASQLAGINFFGKKKVLQYRLIEVTLWSLPWFLPLSSEEKSIFIYLFSNPFSHISGLFLLPFGQILSHFPDISSRKLRGFLRKWSEIEQVLYDERAGTMFIPTMLNAQSRNRGEKIEGAVKAQISLFQSHPYYEKFLNFYPEFREGVLDTPSDNRERVKVKGKKIKEKRKSPVGSPKIFAEDSQELKAAKYLFGKILQHRPTFKQPDLQAWADDFDKIFRIDQREKKELFQVINFAVEDKFWKGNILSPETLRKQYDRLAIQLNAKTEKEEEEEFVHPYGPEGIVQEP